MNPFEQYLQELRNIRATGATTKENKMKMNNLVLRRGQLSWWIIFVGLSLIFFGRIPFVSAAPSYDGCGGVDVAAVNAPFEEQLIGLINQARTDAGLATLQRSTSLELAGRYLAADMAQDDYFGHTISDRVNGELVEICPFSTVVTQYYTGTATSVVGAGAPTANGIYTGWDNGGYLNTAKSDGTLKTIGVGYYSGGTYGHYWVLMLGYSADSATPIPTVEGQPTNTPAPTNTPTPFVTNTPIPSGTPVPLTCTPSNGRGGLAVGTHDVVIAGQPVTIIVGEGYDPSRPTYLAFYLHGDEGGYNYHAPSYTTINKFITQNGWIYVAPQAPQFGTGYYPWYSNGVNANPVGIEANAMLLEDALETIFSQYNVCRDVLFGASASGGSWFYDGYFLPTRGDKYPAFMNLNCGASGINSGWASFGLYQKLQTLVADPNLMARTRLKYTLGTADFLYDDALVSSATLSELGFAVETEFMEGVDHCDFDVEVKSRDYWAARSAEIVLTTPGATSTPQPTMTPTGVSTTITPAVPTNTPTPANTPLPLAVTYRATPPTHTSSLLGVIVAGMLMSIVTAVLYSRRLNTIIPTNNNVPPTK